MPHQPIPASSVQDVYTNLSKAYTDEPDAVKRFETLNDAFKTMAKLVFPDLKTMDAIHALAKYHRPLSVVFGFFSAHHKMLKLGQTKSFSYENLDNLYILRTLCEFWEQETKQPIPDDLQQAYAALRSNYELSKSKSRLDSKINELMFHKNSELELKIQKTKKKVIFLLIACLLSVVVHVVLILI
jgi:hypothetical protein